MHYFLFKFRFEAKDLVNPTNFSYKVSICEKITGQQEGVGAVQFSMNDTYILGKYSQVEIVGGGKTVIFMHLQLI